MTTGVTEPENHFSENYSHQDPSSELGHNSTQSHRRKGVTKSTSWFLCPDLTAFLGPKESTVRVVADLPLDFEFPEPSFSPGYFSPYHTQNIHSQHTGKELQN